MKLVIVESPAKAKTIKGYLGNDFVVESSIGHIRDLPANASEIPKEYREEPWSRIAVDVHNDFKPIYVVSKERREQVKRLRAKLREADELFLATDEDREGEAIAWHLLEVLKPKKGVPVHRMRFGEITKSAIHRALEESGEIDDELVEAQETRRILDRLVGYEVSPILWRFVAPKLSAGRVQSAATRMVVERELERMRFVAAEYWDLEAKLESPAASTPVEATLNELGGMRIAQGRDFSDDTGELKDPGKVRWVRGDEARRLAGELHGAEFRVAEVRKKPFTRKPAPPFITSSLQQEASRKLRYGAQRTMRIAQSLYERGFITYMRTDSTRLSDQAIDAARGIVRQLYGDEYLPPSPRIYETKSESAQEAHEAIRPSGDTFRTPQELRGELDGDESKLYELIWKRTVASQMKNAEGLQTTVRLAAPTQNDSEAIFHASGNVIKFPGFWRAYVEGSDDPEAALESREKILPDLDEGARLHASEVQPVSHETTPPARYTEASLIKELEERGIGRPSTYAATVETIQNRKYVWKKGTALVPTFTAFAVTRLLEGYLGLLVDYDFTKRMEDDLDRIARGEQESIPWLRAFYFGEETGAEVSAGNGHPVGLKPLVDSSGGKIDARAINSIPIGKTEEGDSVVVRVGRYGPYVEIGEDPERRGSVPEDLPPDEVTVERALELVAAAAENGRVVGEDPETGKPIYVKTGRYGPYVQLGDPELTPKGNVKRGTKPKMASLWPGMKMESLTLDEALLLLSFPRDVGQHPETGETITAQDGRFGPYIKMGDQSRSLPDHDSLKTVTVEQAVELLKQPARRRNAPRQAANIAELGNHPTNGLPIVIKSGRFGPYVTDGQVNASVPKGRDPEKITLDDAVELIAAREQRMRDQGKDPRAPKKKAARKKTTKKSSKKSGTKKAAKKRTTKTTS